MNILYYITQLINEHLMEPLALFVDGLNYELITVFGFDYNPELTMFFTLLLECCVAVLLLYALAFVLYTLILTIYRKVFKL